MERAEYPSLAAFYSAAPERRTSPEDHFGVDWHAGDHDFPRWRVSYLRATHEIYAVQLNPGLPGPVRLLGIVPPDPTIDPRRDRWRPMLDRVFDGWDDPDISGNDLAWVEQRLAAVQKD